MIRGGLELTMSLDGTALTLINAHFKTVSMLAEPSPRGWRFTMFDQTDAPFASCRLEQRQLSCS